MKSKHKCLFIGILLILATLPDLMKNHDFDYLCEFNTFFLLRICGLFFLFIWASSKYLDKLDASEPQIIKYVVSIEEFLRDLNDLHAEKLSCEEFRSKYFDRSSNAILADENVLISSLDHFLSDEDIRKKDSVYRDMQLSELKKLIILIENGASSEQLENIHFLSNTDN